MAHLHVAMTAPPRRRTVSALLVKAARSKVLSPVATIVAAMLLWEWLCIALNIPSYLLPKPSDFLDKFYTDFGLIAHHMWATAQVILMAFVVAGAVGVTLGYLIVTFPSLERGAYPLIVFLEIIPKTITAPLFIVWFGVGLASKLTMTSFIAFFPILVNSIAGFRSIDPKLYHISRSMGATRWQTFVQIQYPAALPHIFAGLKIASVYAVTASIVIEFVGSTAGLGYLIVQAMSFMDMALMFAAILAAALTGLIFNLAVNSTERLFMPWLRQKS